MHGNGKERRYDDTLIVVSSDHGEEFGERASPDRRSIGIAPTTLVVLDLDPPSNLSGQPLEGLIPANLAPQAADEIILYRRAARRTGRVPVTQTAHEPMGPA